MDMISYESVKLLTEFVSFVAFTIIILLILFVRKYLENLFGKRAVRYSLVGIAVIWFGYLVNVLNDIIPYKTLKIVDDVLESIGIAILALTTFYLARGFSLKVRPKAINHPGEPIPSGAYYTTNLNGQEIQKLLSGKKALAITRSPKIWKELGIPYIWVSNVEGEKSIEPTKLAPLMHYILSNLDENTFVILDSLDYLLLYNGEKPTMKFLLSLKDNVLAKNGGLILLANPGSLPQTVWGTIQREFQEL
ncbi:DUF835 domain-containing protein [Pyrococcus abyssi]|uniref:DUF835 domain-containing protein n=1 Tax=Pyrococcus abyssi (strain GE5 / Orsay) TaxID=272844 RepID=Q9V069_PYRAB|nr:DUF835 domain-containing protein [Pyrococcus abyssi]CAB49836.1 Hypothetical protein PAB1746 [Pyrococcus abyssi GE5]CCE70330.1 TPA: hypothetical protein PAB1746 [Pyrococcus abyssi GE5]